MQRSLVGVRHLALALTLVIAASCSPLIAGYSLDAYRNGTTLKAEVSALVETSAEPFAEHEDEVEALAVRLDAAYEFAAGVPNNSLSARQWDLLRSDALSGVSCNSGAARA